MRSLPALLLALIACGRPPDFEPLGADLLAPPADQVEAPFDYAFSGIPLGIEAHEGVVSDIAFLPGGRFLASVSFDDLRLAVWDVGTGALVAEAVAPRRLQAVAALPDALGLLTADAYGFLEVWMLTPEGLEPVRRLNPSPPEGGLGPIESRLGHAARLALSPNGRLLASASTDPLLTIWDLRTWKEIRRIDTGRPARGGLAFSPDGRSIAVGDVERGWTLWDLATGTKRSPEIATSEAGGIAFLEDGKRLATSHVDGRVGLWDVGARPPRAAWIEESAPLGGMAALPGGGRLAIGTHDGQVVVRNLAEEHPTVRRAFDGPVSALALNADGTILAVASRRGAIVLFR